MSRRLLGPVLFVLVAVASAALGTSTVGAAPENSQNAIPRALEDWQAWAFKDQEFRETFSRECPLTISNHHSPLGSRGACCRRANLHFCTKYPKTATAFGGCEAVFCVV
jgi:hypothetical protein